ncbi:MAG: hypothetical protein NC299_11825 [Lachnospiraceae bacterium]|nr:hypothetical protein [Lachnospiraceae bacterium]
MDAIVTKILRLVYRLQPDKQIDLYIDLLQMVGEADIEAREAGNKND